MRPFSLFNRVSLRGSSFLGRSLLLFFPPLLLLSFLLFSCAGAYYPGETREPGEKVGEDGGPELGKEGGTEKLQPPDPAPPGEFREPPELYQEPSPNEGDGGDREWQHKEDDNPPDLPSAPPPLRQERSCPASLQGSPCSKDSKLAECSSSCAPSNIAKAQKTQTVGDSTFFATCKDKGVLCVGPQFPTKTLRQAAALLQDPKNNTTHILVASGWYPESVTFANLPRDLTIEGQSNDPQSGTRIFAPFRFGSAPRHYAALRFEKVKTIKLERLVLAGHGHGVYVNDFVAVNINNNHHTTNLHTGATLAGKGTVSIKNSLFTNNGLRLIPAVSDDISVNINNNHRTFFHPSPIAVNINNNHRTIQQTSFRYEGARFGVVVEGALKLRVEGSLFQGNGSGGLHVASSQVAVNINNNHRVLAGDQVAVNINNNHREVMLKGNNFHHNGPLQQRQEKKGKKCEPSCPTGSFCQAGLCYPQLITPTSQGAQALVGIGASVVGYQKVTVEGNSFFGNNTGALVVASVNNLFLTHNAIERNGLHPQYTSRQEFLYPAVKAWNITNEVSLKGNLITDNAYSGVALHHHTKASQPLQAFLHQNHISGNGRFLPQDLPRADGIHCHASRSGEGIKVDLQENYFANNTRAGFASYGHLFGLLQSNTFADHPRRAIALLDAALEPRPDQEISIFSNRIDGAHGYGIQIYEGNIAVNIQKNTISKIQPLSGSSSADAEADGINLTNLTPFAKVRQNDLSQNKRAAIFLHSTPAHVENNTIHDSRYGVLSQGSNKDKHRQNNFGAGVENKNHSPTEDLPNRKEL